MTNWQQVKLGDFVKFNPKEHLQKVDIYKQCAKMHISLVADFATDELKTKPGDLNK